MIVYFADRTMTILGHASDKLNNSYRIANDSTESDVEHGTETLSFSLYFEPEYRETVESLAEVGNYVLRYISGKKEQYRLYTIIDSELDVNNRAISVYLEDGGLDLLNETAGPFEPEKEMTIKEYFEKYLTDTGFKIGKNEIGNNTKKRLVFDNDDTVTARLLSIADQFEAELMYTYEIDRLKVTSKSVDILKKIGSEKKIELRTDREIDNLIVKKSIANLCTGIYPIGASPDGGVGAISGKDGNGKTLYTWIKFANSKTGAEDFDDSASDKTFIGLAMEQHGYLESENASKYVWYKVGYESVKVIPSDVSDGIQLIDDKGEPRNEWMWIRFAEDEYGTNMRSSSNNFTTWIGFGSGDKHTPSDNPEDYEWDRYAGNETTTLYLKSTSRQLGDGRKCYWKFSNNSDGSGGMSDSPVGKKYVGFICCYESSAPSNNEDYIWDEIVDNSTRYGDYVEFDWKSCGIKQINENKTEIFPAKYLWIKFAKDNDNNRYDSPKGCKYIGLSYNHEKPNATYNANYSWSDITGNNEKVTLENYVYDQGDFFIKEGILYSRSATEKWSRYKNPDEVDRKSDGSIVRRISYNQGDPDKLFEAALKDLKKYSEPEVNYEVTIHYLPSDVNLGDTINIVDDAGLLYVSARILKITRSESNDTTQITLGDFLIKDSGIAEQVQKLAEEFAANVKANPVLYTWTVYADDDHGTGMSLSAEGKAYMGMATNKLTKTPDLEDYQIYEWSKVTPPDIYTLKVSSNTGSIYKKGTYSVIMHAMMYKNGELITWNSDNWSGYTVKWYVDDVHIVGMDNYQTYTKIVDVSERSFKVTVKLESEG